MKYLALLLALTLPVFAEDAKPAADRLGQFDPEQRAQALKKEIGLTDEQTAKAKKIYESVLVDLKEEVKTLRENASLSPQEKRQEIMKFLATTGDEIEEILTPEQKPKFKAYRDRRREEIKQRLEARK